MPRIAANRCGVSQVSATTAAHPMRALKNKPAATTASITKFWRRLPPCSRQILPGQLDVGLQMAQQRRHRLGK